MSRRVNGNGLEFLRPRRVGSMPARDGTLRLYGTFWAVERHRVTGPLQAAEIWEGVDGGLWAYDDPRLGVPYPPESIYIGEAAATLAAIASLVADETEAEERLELIRRELAEARGTFAELMGRRLPA